MNLRTKVLVFCLSIGMAPVVMTSFLAHRKASNSLESSARESSKALKHQAVDKMAAIRDLKAASVEAYFGAVQNQIKAFSQDAFVVDALVNLPDLFDEYVVDSKLSPEDLVRMRVELKDFYKNDFGSEYERQTGHALDGVEDNIDGMGEATVALQHAYIKANPAGLDSKSELELAPDGSWYSEFHETIHPTFLSYQTQFGFNDIFLCRPESGEVVYSVSKSVDFATSLTTGAYADSNLGDAFRGANDLEEGTAFVFADFRTYTPGFEAPALFVAAPVFKGEEKLGVVIFELPMDAASKVMAAASGLGESGDSYLVGPDGLMRSNSRQDPGHRSVHASFTNPRAGACKTAPVEAALAGETGAGVAENFSGVETLSAWKPLDVLGTRWALITEISTEEGLATVGVIRELSEASISQLVNWILISVAVVMLVVIVIGIGTAKAFLRPIQRASDTIEAMGVGDLSTRIANDSQDEIGHMTQVVDSVLDQLVGVFGTDTVEWVELGRSIEKASGLAGMIEQASLNIMQVDLTGSITYVNHSSRTAFASVGFVNVPGGGPEGAQVRELLQIPKGIGRKLDPAKLPWTEEYIIDGESIELSASSVEGADGSVLGIMVTWTIRTVERNVQEKVRETTAELNNFVGSLRGSAQDLLDAAESTSEAAARTQEGTTQVNEDTKAVSSASEEMSNTVGSIAQSSRDLADAVERAVTAGGRAVEVVGSLSVANDQISRVSETIAKIADQTNLLALNATIEAAGAGEAGRGFAVVASEVKDLARETMSATNSIAEQVRDISGRSQEVSQAIDDITKVVAGVSDLAMTLSSAVEEQDITTREISEATSRSAERVRRITSEMGDLSSSAADAKVGARSVLDAAEQLGQLAKDLAQAGSGQAA